jgi:hypothetical protein
VPEVSAVLLCWDDDGRARRRLCQKADGTSFAQSFWMVTGSGDCLVVRGHGAARSVPGLAWRCAGARVGRLPVTGRPIHRPVAGGWRPLCRQRRRRGSEKWRCACALESRERRWRRAGGVEGTWPGTCVDVWACGAVVRGESAALGCAAPRPHHVHAGFSVGARPRRAAPPGVLRRRRQAGHQTLRGALA